MIVGATGAIALAGSSLIGGFQQAGAARAQARASKAQGEIAARQAEIQAEDALKRGEESARQAKQQTKQLIGKQRAAQAAQGIDVGSGTALDIQAETAEFGAIDESRIRLNAYREAWGFKTEANTSRTAGRLGALSAKQEARSSLLTGGLGAIGYGASAFEKKR